MEVLKGGSRPLGAAVERGRRGLYTNLVQTRRRRQDYIAQPRPHLLFPVHNTTNLSVVGEGNSWFNWNFNGCGQDYFLPRAWSCGIYRAELNNAARAKLWYL